MSDRTWCWPFFHTWSKWSAVKVGVHTIVYNPSTASLRTEETKDWYYQERTCQVCGLYQTRSV